jgi:hypothetical protein
MYKAKLFSNPLTISGTGFIRFILICLAVWSGFSSGEAVAQGNILITPRRVVFEGSKKSQELTLANTGTDTSRYVVSVVQMRMKEDGSFEQITEPDPGQMFADKYFRFFPRTVTLPPNQSQVIKMQLTKNSKMEAGEYRSHIYFRAVKKDAPLGEIPGADSNSVTVKLSPVFGITIPAIVRVGQCSGKVVMSDIGIDLANDTVPRLKFDFIRSGNISVYGDILVNHTSPDGKVTKVATVKGVAVYTPNTLRKFHCNLDNKAGVDYRSGKLSIVYTSSDDIKSSVQSQAELVLH